MRSNDAWPPHTSSLRLSIRRTRDLRASDESDLLRRSASAKQPARRRPAMPRPRPMPRPAPGPRPAAGENRPTRSRGRGFGALGKRIPGKRQGGGLAATGAATDSGSGLPAASPGQKPPAVRFWFQARPGVGPQTGQTPPPAPHAAVGAADQRARPAGTMVSGGGGPAAIRLQVRASISMPGPFGTTA